MDRDRDEDTGQFTATVGDRDVVDAVASEDAITTADVADALGVDRSTAYRRLEQLATEGVVERVEVGNSLLWETDREPDEPGESDERRETTPEDGGFEDAHPGGETGKMPIDRPVSVGDTEVVPREQVSSLDLPGNGSVLEARRDLVARLYREILVDGEVTVAELKALTEPDAVSYSSIDAVWSNMIRGGGVREPVFDRLPYVETPGKGGKVYRRVEQHDPDE